MRFHKLFTALFLFLFCLAAGCGAKPANTVSDEGSRVDPAVDPAFYNDSANLDPLAPAK